MEEEPWLFPGCHVASLAAHCHRQELPSSGELLSPAVRQHQRRALHFHSVIFQLSGTLVLRIALESHPCPNATISGTQTIQCSAQHGRGPKGSLCMGQMPPGDTSSCRLGPCFEACLLESSPGEFPYKQATVLPLRSLKLCHREKATGALRQPLNVEKAFRCLLSPLA